MRHGKRHLPYAASTVLGLTAPALAALLLTSSVPTNAAPAPVAVPVAELAPLHVPVFTPTAPSPAAVPVVVVPRVVAQAKAPVRKVAVKAPARPRVTAKPAVQKAAPTAAPKPAPKPTATRSTSSTSSGSTSTAQPRGTDDYKWKNSSDYYALDSWDFTQRQCVSFAAWRLAQHGKSLGANAGGTWGSALNWDETARAKGFAVTTKARVGAIAQWNAGEGSPWYSVGSAKPNGSFSAGSYGHVGWVKMVYSDGSALVEQYNMGNSRNYSVMRVKAPRYLAIG